MKIVSGEQFYINETNKFENKTWWEMRPQMVQVPASSWASMKAFIVKICKKTDQCQKEVGNWENSVKTVDDQLEKKGSL